MDIRTSFLVAKAQGKTVSFICRALDGTPHKRFGIVDHVGTEHVVIFDTVRDTSSASRLDRVESLGVF